MIQASVVGDCLKVERPCDDTDPADETDHLGRQGCSCAAWTQPLRRSSAILPLDLDGVDAVQTKSNSFPLVFKNRQIFRLYRVIGKLHDFVSCRYEAWIVELFFEIDGVFSKHHNVALPKIWCRIHGQNLIEVLRI